MENKNAAHLIWIISTVLISIGIFIPALTGAGNLEPTAAPAPTMKTLDEVEPRIPIPGSSTAVSVYKITQSGSYYLAGDRVCDGTGIYVNADNVTIDLMGYSLIGPGTGTEYGVVMNGRSNVEIRNGTVRAFYYGVYEPIAADKGHRIINVRSIANSTGGIYLANAANLVKDCTISENGSASANSVCGIWTGEGSTVVNNVVNENGSNCSSYCYGISVGNGSTVASNTVRYNGYLATGIVYGIKASRYGTVTGNTVYYNGRSGSLSVYGIHCAGANTVTKNTVAQNGYLGSGYTYGLFLGEHCLVDQNTSYNNDEVNMYNSGNCTFGVNHAP